MTAKICFVFLFTAVVSLMANTIDVKSANPVTETTAEATKLADVVKITGRNEWKITRDGVKWLPNCDFPGYDIKYSYIGGLCSHCKCSELCIDTSGCNAFSWMNGWCYLKNIPAKGLNKSPTSRGGCGILPWEFPSSVK